MLNFAIKIQKLQYIFNLYNLSTKWKFYLIPYITGNKIQHTETHFITDIIEASIS